MSRGRAVVHAAALVVLVFTSLAPVTAAAQARTCLRSVSATPAMNGVVASGVVGSGGCAAGTLWPQVPPNAFLPTAGSPEAFLYAAYNPGAQRLYVGIDLSGDSELSDQDYLYLLFDANNDDAWNAGDFYLRVQLGPNTPIQAGAACGAGVLAIQYFQWNGSSFAEVTDPAVVSQMQARVAYDYETVVDSDTNLWNLEVSLPVNFASGGQTWFPLQTAGSGFGMGAYLFVDQFHLQTPQGTVLKWPDTMKDRTITQKIMTGIPRTEASELADVTLAAQCFDVNFVGVSSPWEINGATAAAQDKRLQRDAVNSFRVRFNYDGPGTTAAPLSNKGTVRLALTPYTAIGGGTYMPGDAWAKELAVELVNYNQEQAFDFTFDFHNPPSGVPWANNIEFVCATTYLVSFQHDDVTWNDSNNVNHNYFTTSSYSQHMRLAGDVLPTGVDRATVYLQMESTNDPAQAAAGTRIAAMAPPGTSPLSWLVALAVSMGVALLARRRRWSGGATALAVAVVLALPGCRWILQLSSAEKSRWSIANAKELGLEPVPGRPNWYRMPLARAETKDLQVDFTGASLPYTPTRQRLQPAAPDGSPGVVRVPVKPGQAVAVLAFGQVDLDGDGPLPPTSATGLSVGEPGAPGLATHPSPAVAYGMTNVAAQWLLRPGYYVPSRYAGALVGSFDDFETAFVVGREVALQVPEGARQLSLAVNAPRGGYAAIKGAYDLVVVTQPAPAVPTHTHALGSATYHVPPTFPTHRVLTTLHVWSYLEILDGAGGPRTLQPLGGAHMSVYETHAR